MTPDADDALSWEGDEDLATKSAPQPPSPALPEGWNALGKDSETVGRLDEDGEIIAPASEDEHRGLSTPMLLFVGIIGGVYLLYTVGWIIGGVTLQGSALFLVSSVMYQVAVWAAVLAPALWFAAVWMLTRRSAGWIRVLALLVGVALLVPWPFVMTGAVGA